MPTSGLPAGRYRFSIRSAKRRVLGGGEWLDIAGILIFPVVPDIAPARDHEISIYPLIIPEN